MPEYFSNLLQRLIYIVPVLLISLPLHEFAHAYAANKLGDPTAKLKGRLTLNPLKHLDPMGTLMLIVASIGWAKPVPVNAENFKDPRQDMVKVGLAGPLMNILIALVSRIMLEIFFHALNPGNFQVILLTFLNYMYFVNLYLAVFNLLPIPPLDGSRIFFGILPERLYFRVMRYEQYFGIALIILVVVRPQILGAVLGTLIYPFTMAFDFIAEALVGIFI
ncbi:MAG: site-2 protease family protein [Clostridia bacterium]